MIWLHYISLCVIVCLVLSKKLFAFTEISQSTSTVDQSIQTKNENEMSYDDLDEFDDTYANNNNEFEETNEYEFEDDNNGWGRKW